jgi:hypothetical protein
VLAFYLLDFALNALQASLRNLLLDIAPPEQLSAGNAWHGRMLHAGNIIGYGFGMHPLSTWFAFLLNTFDTYRLPPSGELTPPEITRRITVPQVLYCCYYISRRDGPRHMHVPWGEGNRGCYTED